MRQERRGAHDIPEALDVALSGAAIATAAGEVCTARRIIERRLHAKVGEVG